MPASAASRNSYQRCAGKLIDVGLAPELVAVACGSALHPDQLGSCVMKIHDRTDITAIDALSTCVRVRRPEDLATCVVDISEDSDAGLAPVVLDNCRRSLLPVRYSECVVGLSRKIEILPGQAMATCIDAADRPGPFDRSFIPQSELMPPYGTLPDGFQPPAIPVPPAPDLQLFPKSP
ncbi:hypothetical protein NG798_04330 [Ancylothrix sp. C2]|uniref:hypothetical protein n=1 Tax=Ancylothrix sp. D3o TaxID=2953691 RepID=UPI0021BB6903|nr:hypothetical protein [Ancylothrix sp. D3o]MCT7949006.1 hypothetical protein [Ancylothrix sp. D3o]